APLHGKVSLMLDFEALMAGVKAQGLKGRSQAIQAKYPSTCNIEDVESDRDLRATFRRHMRENKEWKRDNTAYQRLQTVFGALRDAREPTILFIDHLHRMLGVDWQHYPFYMAPVLKLLLHRMEVHLWGACTPAEYQIIEHDASMQCRFDPIYLPNVRLSIVR